MAHPAADPAPATVPKSNRIVKKSRGDAAGCFEFAGGSVNFVNSFQMQGASSIRRGGAAYSGRSHSDRADVPQSAG
jgi:hypothetical protein